MSDLFLFDAPESPASEPRHKVFFALRPEPAVAIRIARLAGDIRRRHGLSGWPTPAERLHISLNGLGAYDAPPGTLIAAAARAMDGLAWPSFVVAFHRFGSWGRGDGRRALVLWGDDGLIGVRRLHEAIHECLVGAGAVRGQAREFNPHLTLLRDAAVIPKQPVDVMTWRVREVVLLDSLHGAGRHDVLGRWALGA